MRALRLDKMTLAALEATLRQYMDPDRAASAIPVLRMLAQSEATLQARAERLCRMLDEAGINSELTPSTGYAGGGSLPQEAIPSCAVAFHCGHLTGEEVARRLRDGVPAVVCRLSQGKALLDVLAISDKEMPDLRDALQSLARSAPA